MIVRNAALWRMIRTARAVPASILRPPYVAPGHFYSPLTSTSDIGRALSWPGDLAVDISEDAQLALAHSILPIVASPLPGPRYASPNDLYGPADAAVYRAMLHHFEPSRIVEVGSGYSTAVALDESDAVNGLSQFDITCIEPYPRRLLRLLKSDDRTRIHIIRQPVQELDLATYARLKSGDLLFIDSTHVVKSGSDVVWLLLRVLPRLAPGVIVHIHDVFWPFEYPAPWLNERRDWTEIYMLHAFLAGNRDWEILLFSSWIWHCHPELVPGHLATEEPSSIWLRRRE